MADSIGDSARAGTGGVVLRNVALILTVIGGLNWGLVGLFDLDLVAALFGPMWAASRVVYALVGVASLIALMNLRGREPAGVR